MARARRRSGTKPTRAVRTIAPPRRPGPARRAEADLQPALVPVTLISREFRHFGQRRLDRLMDASARMLAVRDVGDVALVQSRFMLDTIEDYVGECGRMAQLWLSALGQNWGALRATGEALGRDAADGVGGATSAVSRGMADLAMTSAVVH